MIYLTGDTHKNIDIAKLFSQKTSQLTKDDYLIVLGDFGLPFLPTDASSEHLVDPTEIKERAIYQECMAKIRNLPYTILFIDGNHDNHPFWYQQKKTTLFGGKVHIHPDAKNVFHLIRGEYYTIEGNTFFVMGGANSIDRWRRKENYTWWKEEIPLKSEMIHGFNSLQSHGNQVDFILTHCMPHHLVELILHQIHKKNDATGYLDFIYQNNQFQYWFCGHYHEEINAKNYKLQILYNEVVCLDQYIKNS